jgi:hypothetical protein
MATLPSPDEVNLPGRVLFRSGVHSQISGAGLRLGEGVLTTDDWMGWLGDESQNPPHWPTSKTVGDFDWSNLNPKFFNINLTQINGQKLADLFNSYITTGETPVITIITQNISKTVYGPNADFADLDDAYAWLSQRTISTRGSVTLIFPAIRIVETKIYSINHPNGDRIVWQGAPLKQKTPAPSSLQVTGNTPVAQATDAAANLTYLRQCFATEIYFTQGGYINFSANLNSVTNIIFSSDGTVGGNPYVRGLVVSGCTVIFNNVAITGFDDCGLQVGNGGAVGILYGTTVYIFGNGGGGALVETNSFLSLTYGALCIVGNGGRHQNDFPCIGLSVDDNSLVAAYPYYSEKQPSVLYVVGNSGDGVLIATATLAGAMTFTSQSNGGNGVSLTSGARYRVVNAVISNNAASGMQADSFSLANMAGTTVINNGNAGIAAYNGSFVFRNYSTVYGNAVDYSPAIGQTGNTGALMA